MACFSGLQRARILGKWTMCTNHPSFLQVPGVPGPVCLESHRINFYFFCSRLHSLHLLGKFEVQTYMYMSVFMVFNHLLAH